MRSLYLLFLLSAASALCGCADRGSFTAPDTQPVAIPIVDAQKETAHAHAIAKKIAANGTKAGSAESSKLLLSFETIESKQAQAENAVASLTKQISAETAGANQVVKERDEAKADTVRVKASIQPKLNRNHYAIIIAALFGVLCAAAGPVLRDSYPVLVFVPAFLMSLATGIAGIGIVTAITGVLTLFGFL